MDDQVGFPEDFQLFRTDLANEANGQARAGKGMTHDDLLGQSQFAADQPHLIFEELPQRFDELEFHPLRQPPDVVVGLDGGRRTFEGDAFDDIGIEGSLSEIFDIGDPDGFLFEELNEKIADDLALLFRIDDARGGAPEKLRRHPHR